MPFFQKAFHSPHRCLQTKSPLVRSIMVSDTFNHNLSLSVAKRIIKRGCTITSLGCIASRFMPARHCDFAQYWTNFKDFWLHQSIRHKCMGKWGPGWKKQKQTKIPFNGHRFKDVVNAHLSCLFKQQLRLIFTFITATPSSGHSSYDGSKAERSLKRQMSA